MVQKSGDHQLRLVAYPTIYRVLYIPNGDRRIFSISPLFLPSWGTPSPPTHQASSSPMDPVLFLTGEMVMFLHSQDRELEWGKLWGNFRDLLLVSMMKRHVWQPRKWFDAKDGPFMSTWFEESVFFWHLYQNYRCLRGIFSVCEAFSQKKNLSKVVGSKGEASDFLEEKTLARLLGLDSKGERFYDLSPP